jgi:hypothetical protein
MRWFGVSFFICLSIFFSSTGLAQTNPTAGIQPFSTNQFGIDLATSNINLSIPIRSKPTLSLALSTTFTPYQNASSPGLALRVSSSGMLGYTVASTVTVTTVCGTTEGKPNDEPWYLEWYIYDSTGARHPIPFSMDQLGCHLPPATAVATDGSGLTLVTNGSNNMSNWLLYSRDGSSTGFSGCSVSDYTETTDSVVLNSGPCLLDGSYTDALSSTAVLTASPTDGATDTYTYTDTNGNDQTVTVTKTAYYIWTAFGCNDVQTTQQYYLPTTVTLPTGAYYTIAYEQSPGKSSSYRTGRLAQITYPSGGTVTYAYSGGTNGLNCTSGVIPTITVTVNDSNGNKGQYTIANSNTNAPYPENTNPMPEDGLPTGNYTITETDPASNVTVYSFAGEYQTQAAYYQGSASGTPLKTITTCYNGVSPASACVAPTSQPVLPFTQTDVYTSLNGFSSNRVTTTYDNYGDVTSVLAYDFGGTTPLSSTYTYYGQSWNGSNACNGYSSGYIYNTPCFSYTTNSSGTTVAQTQISYSSTGHPTTTMKWTSGSTWLTSGASYNSNGTMATYTDPNNSITQFSSYQCNGLLPGTTTLPQVSGESFHMSSTLTWSCNGGLLNSSTDLNTPANTTTYTYNDPLWRLTEVSYPDGGSTTWTYNTGSKYPWTMSTSSAIGGSVGPLTTTTTYDGLARQIQQELTSDPSGTTYTATTYNAIGEVYQVYNPTRCSPPTTNCGSEATWGGQHICL